MCRVTCDRHTKTGGVATASLGGKCVLPALFSLCGCRGCSGRLNGGSAKERTFQSRLNVCRQAVRNQSVLHGPVYVLQVLLAAPHTSPSPQTSSLRKWLQGKRVQVDQVKTPSGCSAQKSGKLPEHLLPVPRRLLLLAWVSPGTV